LIISPDDETLSVVSSSQLLATARGAISAMPSKPKQATKEKVIALGMIAFPKYLRRERRID
jgi:hypothetical protein